MLLAMALAERPGTRGLVVQAGEAAREGGRLYPPGLQAMGLDPDRLGFARVRTGMEALRVVDEALRSGAVAAVVADMGEEPRLDLSVSRRFNLAAARTGSRAFLAVRDLVATSAALTRWRVEPRPSAGVRGRLGPPAFRLSLLRNRLGPTGEWTVEWDSDRHAFRPAPSLSAPLAGPPGDRPHAVRPPRPEEPAGAYRQAG
jgi:protein ImuA